MRSVVVLPQPEGPSRAKKLPLSTSRLRRSTATTSSKRLVTSSSLTSTFCVVAAEASRSWANPSPRFRQHVSEDGHDLVELLLPGHERRRDLDHWIASVVLAADQAPLEEPGREEAPEQRLALLVAERLASVFVLHELYSVEESCPADVANDRQVEELAERVAEGILLLVHVLDDPLPLHDLDVLEGDRRHDGVAAERDPVRVHARVVHERLDDAVAGHDGADRRVGRREPLRDRDQVGLDVVPRRAEPRAEAAEPGDDLVCTEQDLVAVADLTHPTPITLGRREGSTGVLDRLHDHHRDGLRPCGLDRVLEVLEQEARELRLGLVGRTVIAVRVPRVQDLRHERLEGRPQRRDAVDREGPHRRSVIRDVARNGFPAARPGVLNRPCLVDARRRVASAGRDRRAQALLTAGGVVLARELPGRLDGLGAPGDEKDPVQVSGRERCDLGGKLDRTGMRVAPVGVEGQLAHLRRGGLSDLVAVAVADVDREEAGERIEVALAVDVLQVAAVPANDDRNVRALVAGHAGEVEPEVLAGCALEIEGCRGRRGQPSSPTLAPQS
jgi:hypothetical protein